MFGLWLMLAMNGITAAQDANATCEAALCWNVSPQTCVAEQAEQNCTALLTVTWHSQTPQNVCLFIDDSQLQCWHNSSAGQWQQQMNWPNAVLSLRHNNTPIIQTELNVLSRKPKRRRIASPWSIF